MSFKVAEQLKCWTCNSVAPQVLILSSPLRAPPNQRHFPQRTGIWMLVLRGGTEVPSKNLSKQRRKPTKKKRNPPTASYENWLRLQVSCSNTHRLPMMPFREPVSKKERTELVGVTFEKKTTKIKMQRFLFYLLKDISCCQTKQLKSTLELILP